MESMSVNKGQAMITLQIVYTVELLISPNLINKKDHWRSKHIHWPRSIYWIRQILTKNFWCTIAPPYHARNRKYFTKLCWFQTPISQSMSQVWSQVLPGITRVIPKKSPDWLDKNHQVPYQLSSCRLSADRPVMLLGADWSQPLSPDPQSQAQWWLRLAPSTWAPPATICRLERREWIISTLQSSQPGGAGWAEADSRHQTCLPPPIPGTRWSQPWSTYPA